MKTLLAAITCLLLSFPVLAEDKIIVIAHDAANVPVNSSVDVDAEYMATELILSSSAGTSAERAQLMTDLIASIRLPTNKDLDFEFQVGDLSALPVDSNVMNIADGEKKGETPRYFLFTNLGPDEDIHTATTDIHEFLKQVKVPNKTSIKVGESSLAMSSPENYRDQLIHNLKRDIEKTKDLLGDDIAINVRGLENPVAVRRKNDKKVTLFLNYKINISM